jgi:hypothetical protein
MNGIESAIQDAICSTDINSFTSEEVNQMVEIHEGIKGIFVAKQDTETPSFLNYVEQYLSIIEGKDKVIQDGIKDAISNIIHIFVADESVDQNLKDTITPILETIELGGGE